jgi:uncharacterized protein with von Willebrand factor type A (vWA) domain
VSEKGAGREDLLKMLDLAGKQDSPQQEASELTIESADHPPVLDASPTALELDEWGLRRGKEVLVESERLQQTEINEAAAADFHGAAFEPEPTLKESCVDPCRHEFLTQLLQTPDYHALHQSTMLDPVASSIATCAFAEQFAALKQEGARTGQGSLDREMETLRAVGRAVNEAGKEVEECKDACAALGMGPGSPGSNDPRAIAALFRRVRNNPTLRRVCELAGRFRRLAQSRQRQKSTHGLDDVVGVVPDGDVGRLLPHELAKLADDDLSDDALRRLVERQLMCREYHALEPVARGPVIVCVDESGSMQGEKGHTAKALALALAWVARMQKRWISLVAYSGDSGERLLALPPGRWDEMALMDWIEQFIGHGSSLDVPVRELPRIYRQLNAPLGKTDVIFLTDALCRIPAELQQQFLSWKRSVQARLITLVIKSQPGDLAAISDEVYTVPALSVREEAVGRVLSV